MDIDEDSIVKMRELASSVMARSKQQMLKKGSVPSIVIGITPSGKDVTLPFGWNSPEQRHQVLSAIKILFRIKRVLLYVIVNEGWAKHVPIENEKELENHRWGDLAKDPDKYEVISVMVVSPFYVESRSCKIIRESGEDSKVTGFEDEPTTHNSDGDLTRLIPRRKVSDKG